MTWVVKSLSPTRTAFQGRVILLVDGGCPRAGLLECNVGNPERADRVIIGSDQTRS
jgi:hypothetical protein